MNQQKYKAEKVERYGLLFDSKLEYRVYERIGEYVPRSNILVHHKIQLTQSISWKLDFITFPTLCLPHIPLLLIEAKGYEEQVFLLKAKLLKDLYPELFNKLIVVYSYSQDLNERKPYQSTNENNIGLVISKMTQLKLSLKSTDIPQTNLLLNLNNKDN